MRNAPPHENPIQAARNARADKRLAEADNGDGNGEAAAEAAINEKLATLDDLMGLIETLGERVDKQGVEIAADVTELDTQLAATNGRVTELEERLKAVDDALGGNGEGADAK